MRTLNPIFMELIFLTHPMSEQPQLLLISGSDGVSGAGVRAAGPAHAERTRLHTPLHSVFHAQRGHAGGGTVEPVRRRIVQGRLFGCLSSYMYISLTNCLDTYLA